MARFNGIPVSGGGTFGGIPLEDEEAQEAPKSSPIIDTVSQGIRAVADDWTSGRAAVRKRERAETMARGNEASQAMIEDQRASGTYDELQQRAEQLAASKAAEDSTLQAGIDGARDLAIGGVKGAANTFVKLPLAATGAVMDATGTREIAARLGVRNREALQAVDSFGKDMDSLKSDAGKARDAIFESTKGFTDTLITLGANPAMIADKVAESLVGTVGVGATAGVAVRQFMPGIIAKAEAAGLTGAAAEAFITQQATKIAIGSAAAGEGIQAGLDVAGTAQAKGRTIGQYGLPALAAAAGTAAIGLGAGSLARKAGIGDIEADIALRGTRGAAKTSPAFLPNRVAVEGFKEGVLEEMPQSTQEAAMENLAMGRPWDQGLGKAAATGLATGVGMGAGHSAMSVGEQGQAADGGTFGGAPVDGAIPSADLLDTPPPGAPPAAEQTESEKALYTPKSLTALDRVNEIDRELETATDKESLLVERDQITASWPKAAPGAETSFTTETGARLAGQYALMEAGDLTTSHDESLRPTATYPVELQPRERDRHASELQIQGIVGKLDPARLGESADVATGAPIVGADGLVESGNARTIALKRVYQANGLKADDYRAFLRTNAERLGIDPAAIDSMQKPVLVRVRSTPVNRAEFARQANASTVARMSPSEQAKSDAAQIDSLDDLNPDESGDFMSGTSAPFVRRFLAKLPGTEQAGLIDATGRLSQAGYTRMRNAVLAKAYGDSPVLLRMVESLDDNTRNVSKALLRVAPQVAKARESMREGALHDVDLIPDLMSSIEMLSDLKEKGVSVDQELAQSAMFGGRMTPEGRDLLTMLNENARSPKRIAEFIQNYLGALEAAGNPGQGSMFGDNAAPTKADLMTAARRKVDGQAEATAGGPAAGGQGNAQEAGSKPVNAAGGTAGLGSNEAAGGSAQVGGEWRLFGPETGAIGIPRADMPQIKGDHRGALIQFLEGRGITHKTVEMPADKLKPTQAEYSTKKADGWKEVREGVDRSVLASSDGYILDGHHQWVAAKDAGETEQVIQFSVPIKELLAAVYQFPSAHRSEGANVVELRAKARQDFKDALGDLAEIASKHTRAAMLPEDTPGLMPTLIKLSSAAIAEVGYTIGDIIAHVKKALRANPEFKTLWNKIDNATYRKAAAQAAAQQNMARVDDLFAAVEERKGQGDLFSQSQPAPDAKKAMHDAAAKAAEKKVAQAGGLTYKGAPFIIKDSNFNFTIDSAKLLRAVVGDEVVDRAAQVVKENKQPKEEAKLSKEDQERAEKMIKPKLDLAAEAKSAYDQMVLDAAEASGVSIGVMLADLKSIGRAAVKLVNDEKWKVEGLKDLLRSTVVVKTYEEAQDVLAEIKKRFKITRIKNRSMTSLSGPKLTEDDRKKFGGYADVLINVQMPNGTIAEIQINVPAMLAGKDQEGHALYEIWRDLDAESAQAKTVMAEMESFYDAVFQSRAKPASLAEFRKLPSPIGAQPLGKSGQAKSESPSSDSLKSLPSGNDTKSSPENDAQNLQPSGNLSGTFIGSTPFDASIAKKSSKDYNGSEGKPKGDENGQNGDNGSAGTQGQGASPAQGLAGERDAPGVRDGQGRGDRLADGERGARPGEQTGILENRGSDGAGTDNERGAADGQGDRSGRATGVPAGRDIPAKTGRNYRFGDDDLTYAGGWQKKAAQNVEAVELAKKLQAEGRQATHEEQAVLAKFIGWGASEIRNSIFGDKFKKEAEAIVNYDAAKAAVDAADGRLNKYDSGYMDGYSLLYTPGYTGFRYGDTITKEMIAKAKPDMAAKKWIDLRDRLKAVLTDEEWTTAERSTQYAHYTSKSVVGAMWKAVERMGFKGGSILEPGAGIGVFPGLMNSAMATNSVYTGIEFDALTGEILKQLFPDERILVESFVDSALPNDFYDVAVGNPPFADVKVLADPAYKKHAFSLHDYFFAKSLDKVKPGGLMIYVTSRYTMDKLSDKARSYLNERADLMGAIRLPQTAFMKNAGTEVVTDVLFLRKRETPAAAHPDGKLWMGVKDIQTDKGPAKINEYFADHPEMVLGAHSLTGSMYGKNEYTVLPNKDSDIEAQFAAAVENLPQNVYQPVRGSSAEAAKVREIDFNPKAQKEGNYYLSDAGVLMQREGGVGVRSDDKPAATVEILKSFIPLRDALKQAHFDQLNGGDWESSLKVLQAEYAKFVKKHGRLLQNKAIERKVNRVDEDTGETVEDVSVTRRFDLLNKINDDPDYTLAEALETLNEETGEIKESDFLSKRVLAKSVAPRIETPHDSLLSVLNDTGTVDMPLIAERLGISETEAIEALGSSVYESPSAGWQMADEYLSGNVKRKLKEAQEAAKTDKRFTRNIEALMNSQPAPVPPSDITAALGMNWIPSNVIEQFLKEKTGVRAKIEFNPHTKAWSVVASSGWQTPQATVDWGTDKRNAADIMDHALTGRPIRITYTTGSGADKKTVFDAPGTEAANQKLKQMREAFAEWLWTDGDRTDTLTRLYNDKFNTIVSRKFDGKHLTLPGSSTTIKVFDHVKRGAWRVIQAGNTYLAHAVGSGKTWQMVISAMEQKRLGLINKPMMVVPNHMLQQFAREWLQLYPAARLMVADEKNFHTDNRRRFVSRVSMSDLDGVIITHSAFKLLDLDPAFKRKMIEEQLALLRAALEEAESEGDGNNKRSPKVRDIQNRIEKLEQKLEAIMSGEGKDKNVRFDQLGVDMLYVDEAHEFRKLAFTTQRQVKGIDSSGSDRAFDLFMKTRWLEEKKPGRSLVMASGTPVTNTLAELYSVQKFMAPQVLEDRGISDFDSWAAMFGQENTEIEADAAGKYAPVTRFTKFVNVPELTQMFREFSDVLTSDHLAQMLGEERPKVKDGSRKLVITPQTDDYTTYKAELAARLQASRAWKPSFEQPNNPDPIIKIIGDGRLAAIDMRFVDPSLPSDPDSKLNKMIDGVIEVYKRTAENQYFEDTGKKDADGKKIQGPAEPNLGGAQMVFSDLGFGAGVTANRGFNARAWMEKRLRDAGVPAKHVAFMSDHKKSTAKLKLFQDVNAGRVRILIGSSKNMGTGVNAQQRLAALHHLDTPWFPADLEQREGRIIRKGNKNPFVEIYAYSTKGSYDTVMWQMLSSKQRFIDQALSGDSSVRSIDDLSEASQFQIATAMTAGDPRAIQLAGIKSDIEKLQRLFRAHEETRSRLRHEYDLAGMFIESAKRQLPEAEKLAAKAKDLSGDNFAAKADGKTFDKRAEWGESLLAMLKDYATRGKEGTHQVGEISGFPINFMGQIKRDTSGKAVEYRTALAMTEGEELRILAMDPNDSAVGVAMRAGNVVASIARAPTALRQRINDNTAKRDALEPRLDAKFQFAGELAGKIKEADALEVAMLKGDAKSLKFDRDEWANAYTPLFKRTAAFPAGLSTEKVQQVVTRAVKGLRNPPVTKYVATVADLPFPAPADAAGVFWGGKVWLVAENITSPEHTLEVFAHETLGHYGLRGFFGAMLDGALAAIHDRNPRVRQSVVEWKARNADQIETYKSEYGMTDADVHALAIEEAMSNWAQERGPIKGALRLLSLVQRAMRAMGLTTWANKLEARTNAEALTMLHKARVFVRDGTKLGTKMIDPVYPAMADPTLADDLVKQEAWLAREAKMRGYKSIDDLAEKNYKVFENLAALWRKKHPVEVALMARKVGAGATAFKAVDTISAAFNAWFGKSKVVDAEGRPLVVYHGTNADITKYDNEKSVDGGFHFGTREQAGMRAAGGGKNLMQVYLSASNLQRSKDMGGNWKSKIRAAKAAGKDGIVYLNRYEGISKETIIRLHSDGVLGKLDGMSDAEFRRAVPEAQDSYIVFNPTQIKSAISNTGAFDKKNPAILFSRNGPTAPAPVRNSQTANKPTADDIIAKKAGTARPIDAVMKGVTQAVKLDRLTTAAYEKAGAFLDRYTPETIKAGLVSDYGIPEAVTDQRAVVQARQKQQTRAAGALLEKLATLTRAESRVAYQWMNTDNPQSSDYFMDQLPPESIKTLAEVEKMIDALSKEAVALGQLSPDAFARNRFAYLRRSYAKHEAELTKGDAKMRKRAIAILGDQYKGRGMTDAAPMRQVQNIAPEWWGHKTVAGKADKGLKGEKFIRLERRAPVGAGTQAIPGTGGKQVKPKLLEIAYWPASEPVPARYGAWERAGTWEVRDTKGADLILWRDFTAQEREAMGEIDEARYAIAKTLHGMIHDVETGKYLQWLAQSHAKKQGEKIAGEIVEASDRMRDVFKPGEWVKVPDTVIPGTQVKKYGTLAGRYLPGPIWNDVRQVVGFRYQPLGETYAKIHRAWKTSKTALSPGVHMNNVMANFVMADWHDVTAGHILKALKLMLSKEPAAADVLARFGDSGGSIGTWAAKELQQEQLRPIIEALEKELGLAGNVAGQVGVMSALQLALKGQFPSAWEAIKPSAPGKATVKAARAMIDMYEAEDQVFRLAAWLRAKENGASDLEAGKAARKSFLDYSINAPWVQAMRSTLLPFVAFTYRAVPMLLETAAKKPWKLLKLGMVAGAINALGYILSGGDEDDERKLLPEEKSGRVWGMVPKLIRMPWNDANGSPVFLDIRRWIPVGDVLDVGQTHSAIPLLPGMTPGGPIALLMEFALNKTGFTSKEITLETDTPTEAALKTMDWLYKAFAPNVAILPGTYAYTGIMNAGKGKTDSFGREQSTAQAVVSSLGIKAASYPQDVLQLNAQRAAQAKIMEIDRGITQLKRELQRNGLTEEQFQAKVQAQIDKKVKVAEELQRKTGQ